MKVLHLTLKAKFYDMIKAGIKPEEYREIKHFWAVRLLHGFSKAYISFISIDDLKKPYGESILFDYVKKKYDAVCFAKGGHFHSSIPQMTLEFKDLEMRTGNPDWGAEPGKEYFVIKLGKIINPSL